MINYRYLLTIIALQVNSQAYKNFKVAVYCRACEVGKIADQKWLTSVWATLSRQMNVDKFYKEIIIPQVTYLTSDPWKLVSARDDTNGWPILHAADYSKGKFYVAHSHRMNYFQCFEKPVFYCKNDNALFIAACKPAAFLPPAVA